MVQWKQQQPIPCSTTAARHSPGLSGNEARRRRRPARGWHREFLAARGATRTGCDGSRQRCRARWKGNVRRALLARSRLYPNSASSPPEIPWGCGAEFVRVLRARAGPFQAATINANLVLAPDAGVGPVTHGVVLPSQVMPEAQYNGAIAATRPNWVIDET